ncbi:alcohol dehydrogenase [Xylona heveae TC161]|uniref:Alcohol dehydrogenase n=1 Tax=Xylona heveae (strain CBS 132557 / TC161) TaxID=1328760 RepID=A0A165HED8_XYLHT|nr:alcohol dehydrogenase [Xylona heveae TC161]KZF23385.1 alcohol dehydrogenase [Xylona heveae TC161]
MPQAVTIKQIPGKPGQVYYPLQLTEVPEVEPNATEVVVQLSAAALNHRDLFIRQHLYPGTTFEVPLFSDGCGEVIRAGSSAEAQRWLHKCIVVNPGLGWESAPEGPESPTGYKILGGTKATPLGTLQQFLCIDHREIEEAPQHLSAIQSAALPLTGLTAWRAVFTKSENAKPGRNILVTGIGGGVALMALLFATAAGCNVFVTSGSEEKLSKAKHLGAKGGVIYKNEDWNKMLLDQLPGERKWIDAIIDGAGGDIVEKGAKFLKSGGIIVSYGMTLGPKVSFPMQAVLKNIEIRGSTMGSRSEFRDMISFIKAKQIVPVISRTVKGLNIEQIEGLFDEMKTGAQFGKLVVDINPEAFPEKGSRL